LSVDDVIRTAASNSAADDPNSEERQAISGTYGGDSSDERLELRVDLDGVHPLRQFSGDVFDLAGNYLRSFRVTAPALDVTPNLVTASGIGSFTAAQPSPFVTVKIPRVTPGLGLAPASVTFSSAANAAGKTFSCPFVRRAFRVVQWEQDSIEGTTPFESYDVSRLWPGPSRVLTVARAYAEAGIDIQVAGMSNVFASVSDDTWSDAELHAAMVKHFSLYSQDPRWRVWLLVATKHDITTQRGVMFDMHSRPHRQGCAVFDAVVGGQSDSQKRGALRTYVHELGHCFNLAHSWEKARPRALSYMNSPERYPGRDAAFWAAFSFQFDDPEIEHLRHGFRNDVIMGGSDFLTGSADIEEMMASPRPTDPILELRIEGVQTAQPNDERATYRYRLGEPMVVELRLRTFDIRGTLVHEHLHPKYGYLRIVVRRPDGASHAFRPLGDRCMDTNYVTLNHDDPIYTSAYIGYGRDGFTFSQTGFYDIRAIYDAPDGSSVVSNVLRVRIRSPRTDADEEIAELYFGDDQGKLFTFWGSDALMTGNDALNVIIERFPKNPMTAYARFAKGINAKRAFKCFTAENTIQTRPSKPYEASEHLQTAIDHATLDNVTTNKAMRELAKAHAQAGNIEAAHQTLQRMVIHFQQQQLRASVMKTIRRQAAQTAELFSCREED